MTRNRSARRQAAIDALRVKIAIMRAELRQETVRGAQLLDDGCVLVIVAPPPHLAHLEAFD